MESRLRMRISNTVGVLLVSLPLILGHAGHEDQKTVNGTVQGSFIPDENISLMFHMIIGTLVTLALIPAGLSFVAMQRPNLHKITMFATSLCVCLIALLAMFGFLQNQPAPQTGWGTSVHAKFGWAALILICLQSLYGAIRAALPSLRVLLPIVPHRYMGLLLSVFIGLVVWPSGVEHYFTVCTGVSVVFPLSLGMMTMGMWRLHTGPGSSGLTSYIGAKVLVGAFAGLTELLALVTRQCPPEERHGIFDMDLLIVFAVAYIFRSIGLTFVAKRCLKISSDHQYEVESDRQETRRERSWSIRRVATTKHRIGVILATFSLLEVLILWLWIQHMNMVAGPLAFAGIILAIVETECNRRLLVADAQHTDLIEQKLSNLAGMVEFGKGLIVTGLPLYQSYASGATLLWITISFAGLFGLLPLTYSSSVIDRTTSGEERKQVWQRFLLSKSMFSVPLHINDATFTEENNALREPNVNEKDSTDGIELVDSHQIVTV